MNDRYARQLLIDGWNQPKLADACVVIVGLGALGNEVARILAMAGVGKLLLCDPDRIETSNLSRTGLFREDDVGQLKVDVASKRLQELSPGLEVIARPQFLVHGIGLAELRDASLVIGCLDSRASRLQLAGRCQLVRAPYIDGGTHPWGGEVRPYIRSDGPCYGCGLTPSQQSEVDERTSCLGTEANIEGTAILSTALVGSTLSMLAVRHLMGLAIPEGILRVDGLRGTTTLVSMKRDLKCMLHVPIEGVEPAPFSVDADLGTVRDWLGPGEIAMLWELPLKHINAGRTSQAGRRSQELTGEYKNEERLVELGVAPREILPVRTPTGWNWIELKA